MSSAYDIVMENRQEIVDKLIAQMEKGYAVTRATWNCNVTGRPYNPVSDAVYKGGNRLRLMIAAEENGFTDPRWMTFKQASERNYRIAAGSKGILLEKWIFHKEVPALDEAAQPVIGADGKPVMERIALDKPIVNYFRVFNGSQVIGLPELEHREVTEDTFSKMADTFEKSSLCPVSYEKQDRAYYSSVEDRIHLPPKESFKNNEARLSVLLHEMAHSTGHESRLNRSLGNGFGTEAYAKEELNAELSSVFLESELGVVMQPDSEMLKDHANYVKSWISVLKNNSNELFIACANAEQITEFLMKNYEVQLEMENEKENGRIEYFTRNLEGKAEEDVIQKHESLERAFEAYKNAGLVDGKAFGISVGKRSLDLVQYSTVDMENVIIWLDKIATEPEVLKLNLTMNQLNELKESGAKLSEILQRGNAYTYLLQSVTDLELKMLFAIKEGKAEELTGRYASSRRPQDYFEIKLLYDEKTQSLEQRIRSVQENTVVNENTFKVSREQILNQGMQVFEGRNIAEWLNTELTDMPIEFMPMGQRSFTFYSPKTWDLLQDHYAKLEHAGYDANPSEKQWDKEQAHKKYIKNVTDKVRQYDFGFMKDYTSEKPTRILKKEEVQTALELGIKVDVINNIEDYHGSHEGDFGKREMTKEEVEEYFAFQGSERNSGVYISPDYEAVGTEIRKLEHILMETVQHRQDMDKLPLEERYTEAMKMAGYERIEDVDGFLAFKDMRSGEKIMIDGWQAVGFELEEKLPLDKADAVRYEELVHPQGRLAYYTQNLGGTGLGEDALQVPHKSFEKAFKAYTESGLVDGKTLGFTINGEKPLALVWYDSSNMENILHRASDPAMQYAPDVAPNELRTLQKDMRKAVDYLQKENAYTQFIQAVTDFEMRVMPAITQAVQDVPEDIIKEIPAIENMTARFASCLRPQDYFEIRLSDRGDAIAGCKETRIVGLDVRAVHANEVVNEKCLLVHSNDIEKKGIEAFADKEFAEWLHNEVVNMDTDFLPYGQNSFILYTPWGEQGLEEHYKKLEDRGYEKFPSDEQYISAETELSFREEEVGRDVDASGFKPTQSLIDNIIRFGQLEGRNYTLKELAELKRQNPDFNGNAEKKMCFETIVVECEEQEMNRERVTFLKQEMRMEQMQIMQ